MNVKVEFSLFRRSNFFLFFSHKKPFFFYKEIANQLTTSNCPLPFSKNGQKREGSFSLSNFQASANIIPKYSRSDFVV